MIRREPFRSEHLAILRELERSEQLILAGAVGDPATGASFVFKVDTSEVVQSFVNQDPYIANGLVTSFNIEPYNVVIGKAYQSEC